MIKACQLIIFVLSSISISRAQHLSNKQLTRELDRLITAEFRSVAPGCAVLVAHKGEIVYERAFGMANLELAVPMNPQMVFRLGSITKQYTSIAILQLVEQGRMSLQDNIQKYIKGFPDKGNAITIEHLLTHTSGIVGYESLDFHIPDDVRIDFPPKQIIDSLQQRPLLFQSGSKYNYSNSNYFILGRIIELVSGKTYKEYIQQNVLAPLGLTNTFYDDPEAVIPNRVSGYAFKQKNFKNASYISMFVVYAAGALMSNVQDLFKWHEALYSYKLVKKATLEKAFTPYKLSDGKPSEYGYGWFIKDFGGSKSIGHGGAIDGFRSMELYLPGPDIFFTILFNSDNDDFMYLCERIVHLFADKKDSYKDLKLPDAVLTSYTGTYQYAGADTGIHVTIKIYLENGRLYGDLSNGTGSHMAFVPQSETNFRLTMKTPTQVDFIVENGKTTKMIVIQQQKTEFRRVD